MLIISVYKHQNKSILVETLSCSLAQTGLGEYMGQAALIKSLCVSFSNVPVILNNQSNCFSNILCMTYFFCRGAVERKFTFKAVLADIIEKHFESLIQTPVVEIRCLKAGGSEWDTLIRLESR